MANTTHAKTSLRIAADYMKTKPLPVKGNPSSIEEETNSDEATNRDGGGLGNHDGQDSSNPHFPSMKGQPNSQLGFLFRVPIEEDPPSKP